MHDVQAQPSGDTTHATENGVPLYFAEIQTARTAVRLDSLTTMQITSSRSQKVVLVSIQQTESADADLATVARRSTRTAEATAKCGRCGDE